MRTGVLGGSFDPVHLGHLAVAEACRDAARLDTVLFMVAGAPPHKLGRALAPAGDRLAMARLAVRDRPGLRVDGRELLRRGPSYTVDTVRELLAGSGGRDEVFWIIGADTLPDLPSWREIDALLDLARILTACREGHDPEDALRRISGRLSPAHVRALREGLVAMPPVPVSSTDIRRRVREGRSIEGLVPPPVQAHIERASLYRNPDA